MVDMGSPRRAAPVWIELFDRFVARWLFAFIALSALGLALLNVMTHGWVHLYAALVHEPSYRDDRLGAVDGVLERMLERDVLPVRASFRDGAGNSWDQVLVLFVSNNAYPLSSLGGRPRLDSGLLEVSALRRTEGQELGRALENLFRAQYQAGEGWARWTAPRSSSTRRRPRGWRGCGACSAGSASASSGPSGTDPATMAP